MKYLIRFVGVVAGGVLGLSSVACSPSNSGGSGATPVSQEQFPEAAAKVLCETVAPCCQSAQLAHDDASCKSTAVSDFTALVMKSSSPNRRYDAAAAGNCLSVIKSELQACQDFDEAVDSACAAMFVGTVAIGGACTNSSDCVMPNRCQFSLNANSGVTGVCAAQGALEPHAKAGEACVGDCFVSDTATSCVGAGAATDDGAYCYRAEGLYCSYPGLTCAKLGNVGDACSGDGCVAGAFCNGRTCAAQTDSGPCMTGQDACTSKSYCNGTQCSAKKADGAVCSLADECASGECNTADDTNSTGTCGLGGGAATPARCAGHIK